MFVALFPELVYGYLKEDTRKMLESSSDVRKIIFEKTTVGINVISIDVYQNIAEWLLAVPEENLKKITFEDLEKGTGGCIDESGILA